MDMKKIIFVLIISTLFMGCAFAANSINDLKVDEKYKHEAGNDYFSLNLNDNKDTGCVIFKNVNDDAYDKISDSYGNFIQDDGRDYIKHDDDMKIDKNPDNTANFTDMDHSTHGVVELVDSNGNYLSSYTVEGNAEAHNNVYIRIKSGARFASANQNINIFLSYDGGQTSMGLVRLTVPRDPDLVDITPPVISNVVGTLQTNKGSILVSYSASDNVGINKFTLEIYKDNALGSVDNMPIQCANIAYFFVIRQEKRQKKSFVEKK